MPILLVARLGIRKERKKTKAAHDQAAILSLEISVAGFLLPPHRAGLAQTTVRSPNAGWWPVMGAPDAD